MKTAGSKCAAERLYGANEMAVTQKSNVSAAVPPTAWKLMCVAMGGPANAMPVAGA